MADFNLKGYCGTESNNDCSKPLDMLAELKSLASKVPMAEGFVVYPSGSGLIMHKIEAGKLRKLLALASANDAFEPPVYVTQQPQKRHSPKPDPNCSTCRGSGRVMDGASSTTSCDCVVRQWNL